jgi:DNA-binding transcriptional LysR family regulator
VASLIDPALRRDITLAWREGRRLAPAAAAFRELARETFGSAEPTENAIEELYF